MKCANDEHGSPSDGPIRLHEACHEQKLRPSDPNLCIRFRVPLRSLCPDLLAVTSSFDDGHELPATKGARRRTLSFERVHRSLEPCEGDLEHHTRKGCLWLGRRDLDDDQSTFLPILCDSKLKAYLVQESLANEQDYIELGLNCGEICKALDRGTKGRGMVHLNQPVCEAINQLTTWVEAAMYNLDG